MTVVIDVKFLAGTFSGRDGRGKYEWPPAPSRIFQALVAAAGDRTREEDAALRAVETAPAPVVYAQAVPSPMNEVMTYVKDDLDHTALGKLIGSTVFPNIAMNLKGTREAVVSGAGNLVNPSVTYVIEGVDEHAEVLDALAAGVAWLGRGYDLAAVTVRQEDCVDTTTLPAGRLTWVPAATGRASTLWSPGFLDHLDRLYESQTTDTPVQVTRGGEYRPEVRYLPVPPAGSAVGIRIVPALSGRKATDAVVACAEAGLYPWYSERANKLLGVLAFGPAETLDERTARAYGFAAAYSREEPEYAPEGWERFATATARSWRSTVPVTAPGNFVMARATILSQLMRDYDVDPEQVTVTLARADTLAGRIQLPLTQSLGLESWHVDIVFPAPVTGPVQVGAVGGTFLPVKDS